VKLQVAGKTDLSLLTGAVAKVLSHV
jgi:hypothetical protein